MNLCPITGKELSCKDCNWGEFDSYYGYKCRFLLTIKKGFEEISNAISIKE